MLDWSQRVVNELVIRGVSYDVISDAQSAGILNEVAQPDANMDNVKLHKAPKVAVYSPKTKQPWDDAVTLVMTYAEIPYETVYDDEVMQAPNEDGEIVRQVEIHFRFSSSAAICAAKNTPSSRTD